MATAPDQIAITQGEAFTLLDGVGNWWKVKFVSGMEGLVPSNYVKKAYNTNPFDEKKEEERKKIKNKRALLLRE